MKYIPGIIFFTILVLVLFLLLSVGAHLVKEETACREKVEGQYAYLYGKSCNPASSSECDIDPTLLMELTDWKSRQLEACNR